MFLTAEGKSLAVFFRIIKQKDYALHAKNIS